MRVCGSLTMLAAAETYSHCWPLGLSVQPHVVHTGTYVPHMRSTEVTLIIVSVATECPDHTQALHLPGARKVLCVLPCPSSSLFLL